MKRIRSSFVVGGARALYPDDERGPGKSTSPPLLVARGDAEDRDDLGLMGLGVGDVGAGAAAEPAGGFVVADEDARVAVAVAVLDPDLVALAEPVLDRVVARSEERRVGKEGRSRWS